MINLSLKNIFLTLLLTDLFIITFLGFKHYSKSSPIKRISNFYIIEVPKPVESYTFEDPMTAYYVLEQLDVFEPVDDKYYNNFPKVMNMYDKPVLAFKRDDEYCTRHRAYFVDHPETVFEQKNFIMDYGPGTLVRNVGTEVGTDIQTKIGAHMAKERRERHLFDIKPEVGIFFTNDGIHTHLHLGLNFGCLTQIANHVPGRATLNRKDYAAESVVQYAKNFETRPQCFNYDKFFPKTWVLRHEDQCKDFFENMFRGEYYENLKKERTIVYIRKIGAGTHQGAGVQPVNATEEQIIRDTYKDGELCGKVNKSTIIQTYIYNPLLLNGHKFDFRIYMVVGSTNPTIAYYHDGFLRVSLHPYNVSSEDKGVLLTNTALSHKIFDIAKKEGNYQGLNETELRNFQMWNFSRLQDYLTKEGKINDSNWVDNYLRPEFKKAMIHLVRMTEGPFLRRSQVYELFGVDFMIDENLKLWFIEANSGPVLEGSSDEKLKFITKMLKDQFEIVFGMLRSRAKRIIIYVNTLVRSEDVETLPSGEVVVKDLEAKRQHFKEITKNYFEPEYEPSPENGFHKIIDDNLSGVDKYAGLIPEECI